MNNFPICHIFAQYQQHSEARIQGDRASLKIIRDAIDQALKSNKESKTKDSLFTSDGEGYKVVIEVREIDWFEKNKPELPYYAPHAGGVGYKLFYKEKEK